ncbi:N-acetylmuramoyl-L-alanine amidase [compost metagenome]
MTTFSIKNHRLLRDDKEVEFVQSPNGGDPLNPTYLIIHYTAGTTASGAINWFKNPEAKASAHLVVDRDGSVAQMMPFHKVAWHAGKSALNGIVGFNRHSIGIEIVNAGKLQRNGSGKWVNWAGNVIDDDDVIIARHKNETSETGWHAYTERQINTVVDIGVALRQKFNFLDVLGHEDIAPTRKVDPGPAFPLLSVQSKILGRDDS